MLTYTNQLKTLVLPEYGRNIQRMVDHCVTIEDKEARTACAEAIVNTMLTLFPAQGDADEYRRKLWDHVMIMSGFRLDVESPYGALDPAVFADKPEPVPAARPGSVTYNIYGACTSALIDVAAAMEEGEERQALVYMIANQMKKTLAEAYGDDVEDERVAADLRRMSHGAIAIVPEQIMLQDYKIAPAPGKKKKKK